MLWRRWFIVILYGVSVTGAVQFVQDHVAFFAFKLFAF